MNGATFFLPRNKNMSEIMRQRRKIFSIQNLSIVTLNNGRWFPPRKGILQYTINTKRRVIPVPDTVFFTCVDNIPEEIKGFFSAPLQVVEVLWVSLRSIDMLSPLRGRQRF